MRRRRFWLSATVGAGLLTTLLVVTTGGPKSPTFNGECVQSWRIAGDEILGVAALAANDVWVVGNTIFNTARWRLIEHWDGHRWRESGTSRIGGIGGIGALNDIAFTSPRDGWAVGVSQGTSLTVHWDGSRWATVPSGLRVDRDGLSSVATASAKDVWAVGAFPDSRIAHWDGAKWTARAVLPVKSARMYSLMTLRDGDVWGVGEDVGGTPGVGNGIAARLHHGHWQVYSHIAPNAVTDVAATSPSDFWAISAKANGGQLVLHRHGSRWRTVPYPFPTSELHAIAARTATDVWVVGSRNPGDLNFHTLATHWDGRRWSEVVLPSQAWWLNAAALDNTGVWVAGSGGLIAHITCVPRH